MCPNPAEGSFIAICGVLAGKESIHPSIPATGLAAPPNGRATVAEGWRSGDLHPRLEVPYRDIVSVMGQVLETHARTNTGYCSYSS